MYKIIFDKDEIFSYTKTNIKEEMEIIGETNLLFLTLGIFLDLIVLPIQLIMAIKLVKNKKLLKRATQEYIKRGK